MEFLRDLWGFLSQRKKFWLLPVIVALVGFGALIVLTSGSAIAPLSTPSSRRLERLESPQVSHKSRPAVQDVYARPEGGQLDTGLARRSLHARRSEAEPR